MLKNIKKILILIIFIFSKNIYGSTSSSFLISKSAFINYDFDQVLYEYSNHKFNDHKSNYLDELISAVVTENLNLASNISEKILKIDSSNQEAMLLTLVNAINSQNLNKLKKLRLERNNLKNELFNFLFFNKNEIKDKKEVSNAFLEIVKSSYANNNLNKTDNYNFLLFYSSLSILIDPQNYEAIFIKAQLLQIIEDYLSAEMMYLKIPQQSQYYLDAQRNIAFNYAFQEDILDAESKIINIININNQNYSLRKILADYYRYEKKYELAIKIYSDLINQNRNDVWYLHYLRGICYEKIGNWKIAEKNFLKSLTIKKDSPDVLNYLAYGWIERDIKIQESFEMLTRAYKANPESYYILDSLAWAHYKKKEYLKAAELMEKVIDMVPGEAISLDHLGDIYFAMKRKREAIYFWKQAKDLAEIEDEIIHKINIKLRALDAS
tara:strand:- start:912 stop:2225 length:1314 start_codon:yes stop_codon:yes gene_type:complete